MSTPSLTEPEMKREAELRDAFWEQVKSIPRGDKIQNCIQCGTCTGSCPVSYMMDITPRETVALFRSGHLQDILHSRTIWICASCYSCTVRCPSGIQVTDLMYALKRLAIDKQIYPKDFPAHAMSKYFIDNVYQYGRNFEMGLVLKYFLKTGPMKLMGNAGFGMKMMSKGRLAVLPNSIKKINEVRAIIDRAKELGKKK